LFDQLPLHYLWLFSSLQFDDEADWRREVAGLNMSFWSIITAKKLLKIVGDSARQSAESLDFWVCWR